MFYLLAHLEIKVVLAVALKVNLEMMIRETNEETGGLKRLRQHCEPPATFPLPAPNAAKQFVIYASFSTSRKERVYALLYTCYGKHLAEFI